MMVSFDFLSEPIEITAEKICVLCIENQIVYRNTVSAFYNNCIDEAGIIFSENFNPIKTKNSICFIPDLFNIEFSSAFIKKIYNDLSVYAVSYLSEEIAELRAASLAFLEKLSSEYDFEFDFKEDFDIVDLLKMQNFKPTLSRENMLNTLLDFLILSKKYSATECFVVLNLHSCFTADELSALYKELFYHNIRLFSIENKKCFDTLFNEKVYVFDEDMCEILEK